VINLFFKELIKDFFKKWIPFICTAIIFFMIGAFAGNVWFHLQAGNIG